MLLVEDDPATAKAMTQILRRMGHEVDHVDSVAEGIARTANRHDVVILDLMLPDGDGIDVLAAIRAANPSTRVVVTTGMSDPDRLAAVAALQPDLVLLKPIQINHLLNIFR